MASYLQIGVGCCANVYTLEQLMQSRPDSGHLVIFCQFLAVAVEGFVSNYDTRSHSMIKRHVPLSRWFMLTILFFVTSVLNLVVFRFDIPMTLHIVFRSSSIVASMLISALLFNQRFAINKIFGAIVVTVGIILCTLASHSPSPEHSTNNYTIGVLILTLTVLLSCLLGLLQQNTYETHGPHWREGLFYTHLLSLPLFIPLSPHILHTALSLTAEQWGFLGFNVATQYVCVSGVVGLSSKVNSVTLNLVLGLRKVVSLGVSVVGFGGVFGKQSVVGAGLVLAGTLIYSIEEKGRVKRE